jgi:hypothetical protein
MEKRKFLTLPGLELRPLGRPARRQSLYRLGQTGLEVNVHTARCCVTLPCVNATAECLSHSCKLANKQEELVSSLPKRRHVAILEDISIVNDTITFFLLMPPCSLLDTYQLAGEIFLDPLYGNIKSRFLRNVGTSANSEASHPGG